MKKTFFILILAIIFVVLVVFLNKDKFSRNIQEFSSENQTPIQTSIPSPASTILKTSPDKNSSGKIFDVIITKNGLSLNNFTVTVGDTVRFINNDESSHWMASGPHPSHQLCPGFDSLRGILRGEMYSFTFKEVSECSFHDHLNAGSSNLKGKITIEE